MITNTSKYRISLRIEYRRFLLGFWLHPAYEVASFRLRRQVLINGFEQDAHEQQAKQSSSQAAMRQDVKQFLIVTPRTVIPA